MTVLLVGNYAPDRQYSMTSFQACLVARLPARGVQAAAIQPAVRLGRFPGPFRKWRGYFDKYVLFLPALRRLASRADLVHVCDQGNAMYLAHASDRPRLLTCHDLLALRSARGEFPNWTTGASGRGLQEWIARSIPKASHVACVSTATILDLDRLIPQCADRRSLVLNGLYRPLVELARGEVKSVLDRLGLPQGGFLMHIGVNVPYKNRAGLIDVLASLQGTKLAGMPLVAAGGEWIPELQARAQSAGVQDLIVPVAHPSDREVAALFKGAAAFVFPSLMEGFGLPVIEAQGYGCPVFCSGIEPLIEIVADTAVTFDPADARAAARAIADGWDGRASFAEAGKRNVERFATERMVEDYARLYAGLLT